MDSSLRLQLMRRRLVQLYLGLVLYGFSTSLLVLSGLGLAPWDVLHQGLAKHSNLAIGTWSIIIGLFVLLLWIPLRERPGIGTVSNVVFIGGTMDVVLAHLSPPHELALRIVCLVSGVFLNGVATGAYIGAGLGPGPRDGLMTGRPRGARDFHPGRADVARGQRGRDRLAARRHRGRRDDLVRGVDRPARART